MKRRAQPGYYPGFSTLSQQKFWDAKTREVILHRVKHVPPIQFFSADQARLMEAVCDHIIPQDDRDADHRIPIVPRIDQRLFQDKHDGYRFEGMPSDRDVFVLGLQAIDAMAQHQYGKLFVYLEPLQQDQLLESIHDGKPQGAEAIWRKLPVERFWMMLVQDCCEVYYAHPYAWDEIGFGGPAYPRAYMRLEGGQPEPWEVDEQRYEWTAPPGSISDKYTRVKDAEEHWATPGEGGTH